MRAHTHTRLHAHRLTAQTSYKWNSYSRVWVIPSVMLSIGKLSNWFMFVWICLLDLTRGWGPQDPQLLVLTAMKWGLTQQDSYSTWHQSNTVYFHLAGMGRGHGEVAAFSGRLGQGFSSACSQRSNYANGDRIWGWVRRLIRPRTLSKLLAVIPATTGTYSYSVHFKTQSPCWAVSGSQMRLHMDLFLSRLIVYHQEATNTISHLQKDRNIVSKLSLCLPPPLPRL